MYIYIYMCVCCLLQICITPTSEDSSVAAGVATVATWWEDCFGEYINDTGDFMTTQKHSEPFMTLLYPSCP